MSARQEEELMQANYKMTVAALAGVSRGALVMMVSGIATALAQDTVRVRGTIDRLDGTLSMGSSASEHNDQREPWDLRPQSTMTNANVEQVVTAVDGQTLTLKYKDGEKKIFVPADTPIVVYVQGDKSELEPGAKVFIAAVKQPDGTLQGRAWRVGRDGVTPPM
jgi:hypothetical protein